MNHKTAKRVVYLEKIENFKSVSFLFLFLWNGFTGFITLLCSAIWLFGVKTTLFFVSVCKQKLADIHAYHCYVLQHLTKILRNKVSMFRLLFPKANLFKLLSRNSLILRLFKTSDCWLYGWSGASTLRALQLLQGNVSGITGSTPKGRVLKTNLEKQK